MGLSYLLPLGQPNDIEQLNLRLSIEYPTPSKLSGGIISLRRWEGGDED